MVCFSYVRYINENWSFITFGKRGWQDVRVPGYAMWIMINKEVIIELNNTNGREINFDTWKLSDDHDNYENGKLPRIFFDRENKKFLGEFQSVNLITNDLNTHIKKIFEKNNLYAFRLKIRIWKKDNREVYAYEKI
jgi:hypothetical protein